VPAVTILAAMIALGLPAIFPVLRLVAAPAYLPAYPAILLLLSALPFQLIAYLVTPFGNAFERLLPRFVMVSAGIAALNALGDVALVPRVGMIGAAIATSGAFAVGALVLVAVVRSQGVPLGPMWQYATPAIVLLPSIAALLLLGPSAGTAVVIVSAAIAVAVVIVVLRFRRRNQRLASTMLSALTDLKNGLTLTAACE
jgi:O-antigen/teichoic acid export membrane protein